MGCISEQNLFKDYQIGCSRDIVSFIPYSKRQYKPLGPKSAALITRIDTHSATNYQPYPFVVEKTEGPWLIDADGNKALDFLAAYSSILTHKNEAILDGVLKEMKEGSDLVSRALFSANYADFVEKVCSITGYDRVMPKSDGGSATDSAVMALYRHGQERGIQNPEIILTTEYFHGRGIIFASSATFDPDQSFGLKNRQFPGIKVVPHTAEAVEQAITKNTIGMFIETHKGEGGPLFTEKEEFLKMRKLARENNILFGTDEIQTGLGRCGHIMAWQEFGEEARPDFVTLGKALGGGVIPVSAVVGTEAFMSIFKPGVDGSTHGGYSLACAAAVASLNYIEQNDICKKSKELGEHFVTSLKNVDGISVENRGALIRVEIEGTDTAKYACMEMLLGERNPRVFMKHGHGIEKDGKKTAYTRIAPPIAAMTKELVDEAVEKTIIPVLKEASK